MGLLDKFFKKETDTQKQKQAPVKKEKVAKRDPSKPNQKELYRLEKAKRKEEAAKRRLEEEKAKAIKEAELKAIRDEEAKKEEEKREAALKESRAQAEAKKVNQEVEVKTKKDEEPTDLYGFSIDTLTQGDIIEVEILSDARENYLARSTKNFQEVYLPKNELKLEDGEHFVRVGDTLTVLVYRHTNDDFYVSLRRLKNKEQMNQLLNSEDALSMIRGHVVSYKEPFFTVKLQNGMLGDVFVRNMDIKKIEDAEEYVGKDFNFTIKQEREDREVMYELDRRAVLNQEIKLRASKLKEGQVLEISEYSFNKGGLEFNYDGIRGFVPMRELTHGYVKDAEMAAQIITGTQKVRVTEIQEKRGDVQILASISALIELPNVSVDETLEINEYSFNKGGVEFNYQGIRGFIPMRELAHGYVKNVEEAKKIVTGDLNVKVIEIDESKGQKQILGSLKALVELPEVNQGDVLEVTEYSFNKGGMEFNHQGIRGFVPMRELSHDYIDGVEDAKNKITGTLQVLVEELDENRGQTQILGSIKALSQAPFETFINENHEGDVNTYKVSRVESYGLFLEVAPGVLGLLHSSDISNEMEVLVKDIKIGDELTVKIKTIDPEKKQVNLTSNLNKEVAAE